MRGATPPPYDLFSAFVKFQSTHPVRGATAQVGEDERPKTFQSTHPVRGATPLSNYIIAYLQTFQSTHPVRGATLYVQRFSCQFELFQSTHPVRGATPNLIKPSAELINFNPRTPCGVRPWSFSMIIKGILYFNPRTPCGVRRISIPSRHSTTRRKFQSTHPVRGATLDDFFNGGGLDISIHAPRAGCDAMLQAGIE